MRMGKFRSARRIAGLATLTLVTGAALASNASALTLARIGTYSQPTYVTSDPTDASRLFVTERRGRITLTHDGTKTTFLNITSLVRQDGEGLLSMAFAPDYATSGHFYVMYTRAAPAGDPLLGALQIDEFTASGDRADPGTVRQVLTIEHSQHPNHNGGQLQFGPDGYLYISTGDGGGGGDPLDNGQNKDSLLGKILRIDPRQSGSAPYTVPADNPFVGTSGADEIWSYGLRNPWRFSFDRATGALVIADVGAASWEEVDYEPPSAGAGRGDNFGWDCREGRHNFEFDAGCVGQSFTDPVFEYSSGADNPPNCSVTGGYVARDPGLPNLYGRYLYIDYCAGELRSLNLGLPDASGDRSEGAFVDRPSSFGEDADGHVYLVSLSGPVYELGCTVRGTPGDDVLTGTAGDDVICGGGGDDTLIGGGGNDRLFGQAGGDTLQGGDGNDVLTGAAEADTLSGGAGTDTAAYQDHQSPVDLSIGDGANDGAAGEDDDIQADVEQLRGGDGSDVLTGDGGPNMLQGGGGDDLLQGGDGDDSLVGGTGADTFAGGAGSDLADYRTANVNLTLSIGNGANDGAAGEGDEIQADVERLRGGAGDDVLMGDSVANKLVGGAGDDALDGGGAGDVLDGGAGADIFGGGSGSDLADYTGRTEVLTLSIGTGPDDGAASEGDDLHADVERLRGGSGGDTLMGSAGNNALYGGPGADSISGGDGSDQLLGEAGADSLDATDGPAWVDHLKCGTEVDTWSADAEDVVDPDCE